MKITAKWIMAPVDTDTAPVTFRKIFSPKQNIKKATLCASAIGLYAAYINGSRVGKGVLTPGFTSYKKRVQYQKYDVTDLLTEKTCLELGVGVGWAVGNMGWKDLRKIYADRTSVIAWLDVVYEDGTAEQLETDENWEVYTSQVTFSEIYHGETVDKTVQPKLLGKAVLSGMKTKLLSQEGEWITEQERLVPIEVIRTPRGEVVLDFGQNMTGYVEVKIRGPRGSRIVLHHAEVLDNEGNFYTANMRSARNENIYILSGEEDVFKPTYTFQGFRYVQLVEYPFAQVDKNAFCAVVVHSELKRTGRFTCGNEKINQLYHNIIWGQKSNYLDIPTDCPQRDERLGWTGDAQVFCRTAAINFDVEKFFRKWMSDVAADQKPNGAIAGIIPNILGDITRISAAWGDAACIIPWQMYLAYGDKGQLKKNFGTMKKWVQYVHSVGPEEFLWLTGCHYGDWLAMDAGGDSYVGATSNDLIASAFFAYSTGLVVKVGKILGEDVAEYEMLYQNVVKAFREYFMEDGMPKAEFPLTEISTERHCVDTVREGVTQTALVLILHFGLCTEEERPALAAKLVQLIRDFGNRMATGFVGTPYILHVLSDNGYTDLAYELLFQEENPSWLYSVCHGATTMWEHWNSLKEDGSFWSIDMNSFNHYAYGAVFDWIFSVSAGIQTVEEAPAYKQILLQPHPHKALGFADTSIESRNGFIRSYWYYKGDTVYYEFTVPEGVTAHLRLSSGYTATLTGGIYHFAE